MLRGVGESPLLILCNMRLDYCARTLADFPVIGGEILIAASGADWAFEETESSLG